MKYIVSEVEMNRRKRAFATLSISLIIGLVMASLILNFPIPIVAYLCFVIILIASRLLIDKSFNNISKNTITLSNDTLERISKNKHEVYLISKIKKIKIKRTTNDTIREIYIWFYNGRSMFVNGLKKFEEFQNNLLIKINKKVIVKKTKEPIDFDHPFFYSALGLLISFVCIYFIKIVVSLDGINIKVISYVFSIYMLVVGLYFIFSKPITKRYGGQRSTIDYIFGLIIICAGLCFLILMLQNS